MSLLPSYVVRDVGGVEVGVVGAVLRGARQLLNPASPGLESIDFADELTAINRAASELAGRGVSVIVLTIHQGLEQEYYAGPTRRGVAASGDLMPILNGLHDEIDLVVSGHTHAFTNSYVESAAGKPVLVVQSWSAGRAVASVDLTVHPQTNEVLSKSAEVNKTYGDVEPGNAPQADVAALVAAATSRVAAQTNRVVGRANVALPRQFSDAGESALGNIVADAQRQATKADFALTNPGGIRTGLEKGAVTWGQLFTVQPFGNQLVVVTLTGRELTAVLERQWADEASPRFLQISGFRYEWDASAPNGQRVVAIQASNGATVAAHRDYRVVVNSYMASGGDGFGLAGTPQTKFEQTDLDALVDYFGERPRGVDAPTLGRIRRRH
jgi:5'-nucleotidase